MQQNFIFKFLGIKKVGWPILVLRAHIADLEWNTFLGNISRNSFHEQQARIYKYRPTDT